MASIVNDPNGRKRILFVSPDGDRRPVRIGKASTKHAENVKARIEQLLASKSTGTIDPSTAAWLVDIDDKLYSRLAAVDLVEPRESMTLGGWLESYIAGRKSELKPRSILKLQATKASLIAHFTPDVPLRKITPQKASEWRAALEKSLSTASVKTNAGNAKTMMAEAVRRKLVPENPFSHLRSGATASKYSRYITPEEIGRVIDACSDPEWKLMFGLARYAGLRVPSESHLLTPADVDWERGRLTVRSPKTEHHEGHEQRVVPISPRLMEILQARFDQMQDGETQLVGITGQGGIAIRVKLILARASVEAWAKLWQTLRASCEIEWAASFPQYAVSKWIGHSITVSGKHYANAVPDELFQKAAQNQAQHNPEMARTGPNEKSDPSEISQEVAQSRKESQEVNGGEGIRTLDHTPNIPAKPHISNPGGAESGALFSSPASDGLQAVITAWPTLAPSVRETVIRLISEKP